MDENALSKEIIGAAIEVHKELGQGLLESIYEDCLCRELSLRGLSFEKQKKIIIDYKGAQFKTDLKADIVVENKVIVELKSVEDVNPLHFKQLLTYLRKGNCKLGLLINFNVVYLKDGIKRVVNNL